MRSDSLRAAPGWLTPDMVGRILALAMPADGKAAPVVQVPTPGVKPRLTIISNPPVASTHSRRTEREAAPHGPTAAASPRNPKRSTVAAASVETPAASARPPAVESGPALTPVERGRLVYIEQRQAIAEAQIAADLPAFRIAHDRGIAIADLARALGQNQGTVSLHTRMVGLRFDRRQLLADPITREELLALADPSAPVPELQADRLKRERLAKWAKIKRDNRAADVARRRQERAQARLEREAAADQAKEERRLARDRQRREREAARAAAKRPRTKPFCEVEQEAPRQSVRPAPSREPALPAVQQARAQPIALRQTPGAPRCVSYAERIGAAVSFLRARQFVVQRHSRDEIIARWHVSGWTGLFDNEQLFALAVHHGLELAA